MALTEEQIKSLKPGDKLVVQGEFCQEDNNGNLLVCLSAKMWEGSIHEHLFFHPSCVSLPSDSQSSIVNSQSKHAPCRRFREGDRVRIKREINGRKQNHFLVNFSYDQTYTVAQDEKQNGLVKITDGTGFFFSGSFYEFELIRPVEEMEPYFIYESKEEGSFDIMKRVGKLHLTRNCIYYKSDLNDHAELTREEALAAAEAERKRLNAEWQTKVCRSEEGKEEV